MAIDPFVRLTIGGAVRPVPPRPISVCRIGRGDRNTVVLAEQVASREHAMVHSDGEGRRGWWRDDVQDRAKPIIALVVDIPGFAVSSCEIGEKRISTSVFRLAGELLDAVWRHPGAYLLSHDFADQHRLSAGGTMTARCPCA